MDNEGLNCKDSEGNEEKKEWMFFLPNCSNTNPNCKPLKGAWVAAITVCNQQLDEE